MKLYRANIGYSDGVAVVWDSNERRCKQNAVAYCKECEGEILSVSAVEIPTDRKGLVEWLNRNVATDNG